MSTPGEALGYKIGDSFEVVNKTKRLKKGEIVTLATDDGTTYLRFSGPNGVHRWIHLDDVVQCDVPSVGVKVYPDAPNKYVRKIHGVDIDVYDVLKAWNVTCPAIQHAIKKLLMPGQRGHKDKLNDLEEAHNAIQRAIELEAF